MNQPVINYIAYGYSDGEEFIWESEDGEIGEVHVVLSDGLSFTFDLDNVNEIVDPTYSYFHELGHVWHYNEYDPRTRTLSVHTDGPTFTCVCDIVRVTKTITHDITHEFLKEK